MQGAEGGVVKRAYEESPQPPGGKKYANSTKSANSAMQAGCIKVLRGLRVVVKGWLQGAEGVSLGRHLKNPQEPPEEQKYANSTKSANSAIGVLVGNCVNAGYCRVSLKGHMKNL